MIRLEKTQPIIGYQDADEESLMDGNLLALSSMNEPSGFFNVTAPDFRRVLAQSIDIMATDIYDEFDLSGINDGYFNRHSCFSGAERAFPFISERTLPRM